MIYLVRWDDGEDYEDCILKFVCDGSGTPIDISEDRGSDAHYAENCNDNYDKFPGLCKSILCGDCACDHNLKTQSIWFRWFFDYTVYGPRDETGKTKWAQEVQDHLDREDTTILITIDSPEREEEAYAIWNGWLERRQSSD